VNTVIGLDLGGTKVHGVLFDGVVRGSVRFPATPGLDGVIASVTRAVEELRAGDVAGVGIGVPGVVDTRRGTVSHAVNLGMGDPDLPLGGLLEARLGVPVVVENDLSVATLGAAHVLGAGDDVALLALGTGMAAGLLLDGRLRRGFRGGAGEIGHLTHVPGGRPCRCGQLGCFESYASGSALASAWPSAHSATDLFAAASRGDVRAQSIRDEWVAAVVAAIRVLALTCDVERILISGGVAEVGEPLRAALAERLEREAAESEFLAHLRIAERVALVPPDAQVAPIGAALAALGRLPG
jgi:predicted NBD/HSP70 family sugar kinase